MCISRAILRFSRICAWEKCYCEYWYFKISTSENDNDMFTFNMNNFEVLFPIMFLK